MHFNMNSSNTPSRALRLTLMFCFSTPAVFAIGQEEVETRKPLGKFEKLPEPLDNITGNVHDFEAGGLFTLTGVRFGAKGFGDDEALIWSLTTNKTVSCRHIVVHFNKLRNVRFFKSQQRIQEDDPPFVFQVYSTRLFFSESVAAGAANSVNLPPNDVFEVWIYLNRKAIGTLVNEKSNRTEFSQSLRDIGRDPKSRY